MLKFSECTIRGNWFTWKCKRWEGGTHAKQIKDWSVERNPLYAPGKIGLYLPFLEESIEGTEEEIESIIDWIVERT